MDLLDEKVLMLEYEAPQNIAPHFYSSEYLNDEAGCGRSGVCVYGFAEEQNSRYEFIRNMDDDEDYDGKIEIELFSYTIM